MSPQTPFKLSRTTGRGANSVSFAVVTPLRSGIERINSLTRSLTRSTGSQTLEPLRISYLERSDDLKDPEEHCIDSNENREDADRDSWPYQDDHTEYR